MLPGFLSLEFHFRFFPNLLLGRLSPDDKQGTTFTSIPELYVLFFICLILVLAGMPSAVSNNSIIGWIAGGIGTAGIIAMLTNSILSGMRKPPSYDAFLKGIFFLFLFLGLSAGIFVGNLEHSLMKGLLLGSTGLVAGYLLGILFGLWLQYLGWLAGFLNILAYLAVVGMLCVDMVLLGANLF
jgi:hypothetical protein